MRALQAQAGAPHPGIQCQPQAGDILRNHRGLSRTSHAARKPQHKPQVQRDVQHGRNRKKRQRRHTVAHCTQKRGKVIVHKGGGDAAEDDHQIFPHQALHPGGDLQKADDKIRARKSQNIQHCGHSRNEHKGCEHSLLQAVFVPLAETDGKHCPTAHAKAQQDGREERHQRERGAHGRQRVRPQKAAHNQRVRHVIALLQQVAQYHGHRKAQHGFHHRPLCQVALAHGVAPAF